MKAAWQLGRYMLMFVSFAMSVPFFNGVQFVDSIFFNGAIGGLVFMVFVRCLRSFVRDDNA